jgi:hypothetical protein
MRRFFFTFVAVNELSKHLYDSSSQAAQYAFANYTSSDAFTQLNVAIQLGSACEWLMRAVLANYSPALLADPQSEISLIALSDVSTSKVVAPTDLRTIAVSKVIQRIVAIDDRLKTRVQATHILALRNAASHMALIDHGALKQGIQDLVMVAEDLHAYLGESPASYWGSEYAEQVDDMRREGADKRLMHYGNKLSAARRRAEAILGVLDADQRRVVIERLEARTPPTSQGTEPRRVTCPACTSSAYLFLDEWTDLAEAVMPPTVDPLHPHNMSVPTYVTVDEFWCPVCELEPDSYMDDLESIPEFTIGTVKWSLEDLSEFWM